jgi:4-diphosphocytidyl-2C-methyl-D-erythritol kinase
MVKFAPTLSKDINAVRSFLREAVMSGSGPSYVTIRSLSDAETAARKALGRV